MSIFPRSINLLQGTNLRPNLLQKSSQHLLYLSEGKGWMKLSCCHNNERPRHEKKQHRTYDDIGTYIVWIQFGYAMVGMKDFVGFLVVS